MRETPFVITLTLCTIAILVAAGAAGQTCVPPATGVYGNTTPPHWWDNNPPQSSYYQNIDDPRWVGAGLITYGDGASTLADFRALHGDLGTNLYLSWRIFLAPAVSANQNALYIGLQRSGGAGDMIIKLGLPTLAPNPDYGPTINIQPLLGDGTLDTNPADAIPTPAWLSDTARVWINNPTANSFAVQVRVPLSAIDVAGGQFKMWYEVLAGTPGTPVFKFTWPRSGADIQPPSGFPAVEHYPTSAGLPWQSFRISSGPGDMACAGSGVSLDINQIGTHNVPTSEVLYKRIPPGVPPAPVNTFFARALNHSGSKILAGTLKARFRLANWGSFPGQENGVDPNLLWSTIPGGDAVQNIGDIPDGSLADLTNENHFDWTLTNADIDPYENGTRSTDNCLLVELTSTTGLTFTNNSIRRNLDFVPASTFTRRAEISVKGMTAIAPDGRDVYLYVETVNMPAHVTGGGGGQVVSRERPRPQTVQQLQEAAASGQLSDAQMDTFVPTYRVHVFNDSGNALVTGGVTRPVLAPQGGFGYRVVHQGDLIGWTHQTYGDGFTLEELAPNFYRVKKVPNGGSVHVVTKITAVESNTSRGTLRYFIDIGPNNPNGSFSNAVDGKWSINAGIERFIAANWSIEGILGYHRFDSPFVSNPHIWQLSAGTKRYFGTAPWHPFVDASVGAYRFQPNPTTKFGGNVGAGVLFDVSSMWGIEGVYQFHTISTSGSATNFSTLQAGVRVRF